jgi:hypothetical protein
MATSTIDYSNTIIYKLRCNDPVITNFYVGHSADFESRKKNHKNCCNNPRNFTDNKYNNKVYEFIRNHGGFKNWCFIIIETANLKNEKEAVDLERYYYDLLKPTLNTYRPTITPEEKRQQNKEQQKNSGRYEIYECVCGGSLCKHSLNTHNKTATHRAYVLANSTPDEIIEYNKHYPPHEIVKCACGHTVYKPDLNRHLRSLFHCEYVAANYTPDEIIEYNTNNHPSVKCDCVCGSSVIKCYLNRHMNSKKHLLYVAKQNTN